MVNLKELSTEKIKEMSLIDLCYAYMIEEGIERLNIYDFLDYIKPLRNDGDEEFVTQAAYFYTDLNLDGRFVCVEDGSWKLRDSLLVEDIKNFVEPSVHKFAIEEDEEETEDIHDEVDELIEDEDIEENEDVYDFDNEGIVSKFNIKNEDEEF